MQSFTNHHQWIVQVLGIRMMYSLWGFYSPASSTLAQIFVCLLDHFYVLKLARKLHACAAHFRNRYWMCCFSHRVHVPIESCYKFRKFAALALSTFRQSFVSLKYSIKVTEESLTSHTLARLSTELHAIRVPVSCPLEELDYKSLLFSGTHELRLYKLWAYIELL